METLIDSPAIKRKTGGINILTVNQVSMVFQTGRPSILKWIDKDILIPKGGQRFTGNRITWYFEGPYIDEVRKILPPISQGKTTLTPEVLEKIKAINKKWKKKKCPEIQE